MFLVYILLFVFGLAVGSFLNVVIYREIKSQNQKPKTKNERHKLKIKKLKKKKSWFPEWLLGRSYCDHCKKELLWHDNIPLLSFVLLRGKCRFCKKRISKQYPLIELLTALEFVWIYWLLRQFSFFGRMEGFYSFALLAYWLYIFSSLAVIFIVDLKSGIIPDWVVLPAIIISILRLFESGRWIFFLAGLGAAGFFLALFLITRGKGLGFGDVKLAFLLGLFLGLPEVIVALFLAFLTGGFLAVILILLGKKRFGQTLPFGPFLVIGAIGAKIWGGIIWSWYMGIIK